MPGHASTRPFWIIALCGVALFRGASLRGEESAGQKELARAITLRSTAVSVADFDQAIEVAERALAGKLADKDRAAARKVLAACYYARAACSTRPMLEQEAVSGDKRQLRDKALADLDKAVEFDDQLCDAFLLAARLQSALTDGDEEDALDALEAAFDVIGASPQQKARAYVVRGQLAVDEVTRLASFEEALKADPENAEARLERAAALADTDQRDAAAAELLILVKKDPANIHAWAALAAIHIHREEFTTALEEVDKIVKLRPQSLQGYKLRAQIHAAAGDLEAALADLGKTLELDAQDVDSLLARAKLQTLNGDFSAALADIERARQMEPESTDVYLTRSTIQAARNHFSQAILDLRIALQNDPKNLDYGLLMAAYLVADKRPRKAIELLTAIVEDHPKEQEAWRVRGNAQLSIGQHLEAVADLEIALQLDPDDDDVLNNLAWLLATSPDASIRAGKRAVKLATRACELTNHQEAHALSTLAAAYAEVEDFAAAIRWAKQSLEKSTPALRGELQKQLETIQKHQPVRERQQTPENSNPLTPQPAALEA